MKNGKSIKKAIVIDADNHLAGVTKEHEKLNQIYKQLNTEIVSFDQELVFEKNKKYDLFTLTMDNGEKRKVWFDITSFFGKI